LPQPGQRGSTRQLLTGKEGCGAKEWIFKSKNNLLVKLPRLKDLGEGGNTGHLYVKGKRVTWKLLLYAIGRKKLGGQKAHGQVSIAKSQTAFEETVQQQQFPVH